MPAYNFRQQFVNAVESGRKRTTIRRLRKTPTKPGDRLVFYTGMRTKCCRRLGEAICTQVRPVAIDEEGNFTVDGEPLTREQAAALAISDADGMTLEQFIGFFRKQYGLPIDDLVLIEWEPIASLAH